MISVTYLNKEPVSNLVWMGRGVSINQRRAMMNRGHRKIIGNSAAYTSFVEDMAWTFKSQHRREPFTGKVFVMVALTRGVRRGRIVDLDAFTKQILDALQHGGVYENDDQVTQLMISDAGRNKEDDVIMIQVAEIESVNIDGKFANGG